MCCWCELSPQGSGEPYETSNHKYPNHIISIQWSLTVECGAFFGITPFSGKAEYEKKKSLIGPGSFVDRPTGPTIAGTARVLENIRV